MSGRSDREVYDGDQTKAKILEALETKNKEERERTGKNWRRYRQEKDQIEDCGFETQLDFHDWHHDTELEEAWMLRVFVPDPQCWAFCERLMPRFQKVLKEELEAEKSK
jgi:hypothetical protein